MNKSKQTNGKGCNRKGCTLFLYIYVPIAIVMKQKVLKVSANKKAEFNRTTEKGVTYTLVPFDTSKASYEQFLPIFLSVVSNMKRIEREKVKAEREAEKAKAKKEAEKKQHEKNLKLIDSLFAEITALSKDFGLPFETAISVYERTKGANYSKELRSMLVAKANEQK